jgi:tetratricopeptide (TPR) repeat protein
MRVPSTSCLKLWVVAIALATVGGCDGSADDIEPVGLSNRLQALLNDPTSLPQAVTETSQVQDNVPVASEVTPVAATAEATPTLAAEASVGAVDGSAQGQDEAAERLAEEAAKEDLDSIKQAEKDADEAKLKRSTRQRKRARRKGRKSRRKKRSSRERKPRPALDDSASAPPPPGLDATDLFYRGKQQLGRGELKGAISSLSASQRLRSSSRTLTKLGQAYFDLGKLKKAERTLRSAGKNPEAMLLLSALYQQTGRASKSAKVYKAFLKYHPDHRRANWVRGVLKTL